MDASPASWRAGGGPDLADLVDGPWTLEALEGGAVRVSREAAVGGTRWRATKTVRLGGGRLDPSLVVDLSLAHVDGPSLAARVGLEWPTLLLGGGGNPAAWWEVAGHRCAHDGSGAAEAIEEIAQGNDWLGLSILTGVTPAADAWWAPIETVSNSEGGFERVYQGSALLLSWQIQLEAGRSWSATVEHRVTVAAKRGRESVSP